LIDWTKVRHFTAGEFVCKCGCGGNAVQPGLIYRLDELRSQYAKPIVITSGYRCPDHNARVSSTGRTGPHTTGLAADIGVSGRDAVALLRLALQAGFTGIGVQQKGVGRFIHLDMIPDSHAAKRPWIWSY
jgi:zinc D-Ala-D-Ala carboxypeptidase